MTPHVNRKEIEQRTGLAAQPPYNFPSTNSCIKDADKWDFSNTSIQNNSKCAEVNGTTALLEVLFAVDNATFAFTFTKQNGMVQINMTLKFVPRVVFSKENNTQQDQVIMAVSVPFSVPEKQSYQCDAAQGYSQKVTVGNNTYNMDLVFQKPTPAPPTPDQHPKFYVNVTDNKFNNTGCISVDAMMMISVPYKTKDNNNFTIIITFGMSGKNVPRRTFQHYSKLQHRHPDVPKGRLVCVRCSHKPQCWQHVQLCKGDRKTNSIVPIAVGAALAGLVVIVLIAYLIGRRRNRKGYESV
ncbi:LAMP1-like protein [Mya arenaria]|uniref:LAMP1-like protein n=1 Tax=Mya arenaria TaxID=6604 RepID=A0ABY7G3B3_MYAAR|nr:LAMP1-like protein [Mya arenaria]